MVPRLSCGRHKELGEGGRPRIAPYHTVRVVVHYSNFRWPMSAKGHLLPCRSLASAAAIPLITDMEADRRRGRNGPGTCLAGRAAVG